MRGALELLTTLAGDRFSADKLATYLSDFSPELLAAQDTLADAAELINDHIFVEDLKELITDSVDLDAPTGLVGEFNVNESRPSRHF